MGRPDKKYKYPNNWLLVITLSDDLIHFQFSYGGIATVCKLLKQEPPLPTLRTHEHSLSLILYLNPLEHLSLKEREKRKGKEMKNVIIHHPFHKHETFTPAATAFLSPPLSVTHLVLVLFSSHFR